MIPKVLSAIISAAILSAVLGAIPCEATGAKRHTGPQATSTALDTRRAGIDDFSRSSTNFSNVEPVIDDPRANSIAPRKSKNQFFDQTPR